MKAKRFCETLPLRVPIDIDRRVRVIAQAVGITKSDAVRIAIKLGLPDLEAGRINIKPAA